MTDLKLNCSLFFILYFYLSFIGSGAAEDRRVSLARSHRGGECRSINLENLILDI